jgi:hypothetical protein
MFLDLPPAAQIIFIKEDCEKGDRNCFPEDRVPAFDDDDRGSGRVYKSISMFPFN